MHPQESLRACCVLTILLGIFLTACEIGVPIPEDSPDATQEEPCVSEVSDQPTFARDGTAGEDYWVAKARYGDNKSSGDYELIVGYVYPDSKDIDTADHLWSQGQNVPFRLTYDGFAAQLALGGTTLKDTMDAVRYPVAGMSGALVMELRAPPGGSVSVSSLKINGGSVAPDRFEADASSLKTEKTCKYLFEHLPTDDFEMTGIIMFCWIEGTTSPEIPAVELTVKMQ